MSKKLLSVHCPTKKKYTLNSFGHYFAGLLDGAGYISSCGHFVVRFETADIRNAYQIRSFLNYGFVRKVQHKDAYNLIISNNAGILKVANLIKDKLKHPVRVYQYNVYLVDLLKIEKTAIDFKINWETLWFSGFFDAQGRFQIYVLLIQHALKREVKLVWQIDQKSSVLLHQIQIKFGGFLGFCKSRNIFHYSSTSLFNMLKVLVFFDKFSLQLTRSFLNYVLIRKAYLIVQQKRHLEESGLVKIKKLKDKI